MSGDDFIIKDILKRERAIVGEIKKNLRGIKYVYEKEIVIYYEVNVNNNTIINSKSNYEYAVILYTQNGKIALQDLSKIELREILKIIRRDTSCMEDVNGVIYQNNGVSRRYITKDELYEYVYVFLENLKVRCPKILAKRMVFESIYSIKRVCACGKKENMVFSQKVVANCIFASDEDDREFSIIIKDTEVPFIQLCYEYL